MMLTIGIYNLFRIFATSYTLAGIAIDQKKKLLRDLADAQNAPPSREADCISLFLE